MLIEEMAAQTSLGSFTKQAERDIIALSRAVPIMNPRRHLSLPQAWALFGA